MTATATGVQSVRLRVSGENRVSGVLSVNPSFLKVLVKHEFMRGMGIIIGMFALKIAMFRKQIQCTSPTSCSM